MATVSGRSFLVYEEKLFQSLVGRTPTPSGSIPNLKNALVDNWEQISAARFKSLLENLPGAVEAFVAADSKRLCS